jgi:hypothetical protein
MALLSLTTSLLRPLTHLTTTQLSQLLPMILLQQMSSIVASIPREMRELHLEANAAAQG